MEEKLHLWGWGLRLRLIKGTPSYMPIYMMSLFRIPKSVSARLEKIQRDFLWGEENTQKKMHLVTWEKCDWKKEEGALGMKQLVPFNQALLIKWNWRIANENYNYWKAVIRDKYGMKVEDWTTMVPAVSYGMGPWKSIRSEWGLITRNTTLRVGNGDKKKFWTDMCCDGIPFS